MATYAQYVTRIRKDLDETTAHQWSNSDLYQWIDEAARDVSLAARNLRGEWNVSFAAAVAVGNVSSNVILEIDDAWWKFDSAELRYPLKIMNHRDMHSRWGMYRDIRQGIPQFLTATKTSTSGALTVAAVTMELRLYPIPQASGVLYYQGTRFATVNAMGTDPTTPATDVVECEVGWEYLIVQFATSMALMRGQDLQRGQLLYQKYHDGLALLASFADAEHLPSSREFVPYQGYGDNSGYADDWMW